jgi:outer membrane protein OmpA-like peptidoglycan-associated protein/tetratricopeptide (TPR) repeat protein
MKKILILTIAILLSELVPAQTKKADRLFEKWEYFKAAKLYEKAAAKKPTQDVYYKLGECYQKMYRYKEAQSAYDKVNSIGHYSNAAFYLDYGLVLKISERYPEAKVAFNMYTSMVPSDSRGAFYASSCDVIVEDHQYDLPITTTGVSSLNSTAADMCPVLYKDGIVFISSRKADGHGSKIYAWDGEYYLDIFYAKKGKNDTNYVKAMPIESSLIDKKYHNGPACFSRNFDTIYFNSVNKQLKGQEKKTLKVERIKIYSAVNKNGQWVDLKPFQYNNDTFSVATPYLTQDGSRLYFSSDMPGGYGGNDIYYCNRQGNGWSKPINMGPNINTFGDEKFPTMDSAGDFYFSSDGYKGYGAMDICVSKNTNGSYAQAVVLKAPFNSSNNDYGITFLKSGRSGYFSSGRNGGKGDDDIYYFNLDKDSLPCRITTSMYIIGYQCHAKEKQMAMEDTTKHTVVNLAGNNYRVNRVKIIMRIHFDFNKSDIRPGDAKVLDSIIVILHKNPEMKLTVNGYCDWRGTIPYNQTLSDYRSTAIVNYMISKGIDKKRMIPKGYGKTNFMNSCSDGITCPDAEQEQNRRAEMWFMPVKAGAVSSIE